MIVIVFTGGTISMRRDLARGGAVPTLRGRDILELAPGIDRIASLEIDDWGAYPGPHMTIERMWALRNRIIEHLARADVDGVVVTHGTDAVEETAYLVARSTHGDKPIVFTGAMRTSSELSWDGPANLSAAVRVAASPEARGRGALQVMADTILSAL
ncbi:MAG TPA: asparaginase domain-containing protein, partial [Gemmatimonadaceae bacterium]|nr:asparaginase domain-containing protein [Gemmatimonadaceae bacterium]